MYDVRFGIYFSFVARIHRQAGTPSHQVAQTRVFFSLCDDTVSSSNVFFNFNGDDIVAMFAELVLRPQARVRW